MCGLSGELRRDGRAADVAAVARMTGTMHDRGPDGSGVWSAGPVALGHRRLKVVDLTEHAAQPMVDSALGLTGVFNGMIYNYPALRRELEGLGHRFFSHGDTEVILKAYAEWGEDFVDRLLGMFAVVIVERDSGRVLMARGPAVTGRASGRAWSVLPLLPRYPHASTRPPPGLCQRCLR